MAWGCAPGAHRRRRHRVSRRVRRRPRRPAARALHHHVRSSPERPPGDRSVVSRRGTPPGLNRGGRTPITASRSALDAHRCRSAAVSQGVIDSRSSLRENGSTRCRRSAGATGRDAPTRSKDRNNQPMAGIAHFFLRPGRAVGALIIVVLSTGLATPGVVPRPLASATRVSTNAVPAYWTVASDGGVFAFGGLPFYGSMGGTPLNQPMVGIAPTMRLSGADGAGYWTVASDGGVFSFGGAQFHGSMGAVKLNRPMVGIAADPGGGYWTVASDGGVFAFDAPYFGSMGGTRINKPVVAMAAPPHGGGYWLFASDGGVFAFGDAGFFGSMGGIPLSEPIVSAASPDGGGYWMLAAAGGVVAFGGAGFLGALSLRRRRGFRVGPPAHLASDGRHRRRPGHGRRCQRCIPLGNLRVRHLDVPGQRSGMQ